MSTNPTDITVYTDIPTFPQGFAGFTPVSLWAYPDLFTLPPNAALYTAMYTITVPAQIPEALWETYMNAFGSQITGGGQLVGYGVWEQPEQLVSIPTQICIIGTTTCLTIPDQICLPPPFANVCIPGAGATLLTGYTYQVWLLIYDIGETSALTYEAPRGQVVIGLGFFIGLVLLFFGVLAVVVLYSDWKTGKLTGQGVSDVLSQFLTAPGQNIATAEQGVTVPILAAGVVMTIGSVTGVALALSGHLGAGPVSFGGGVSEAPPGTTPISLGGSTPTPSTSRRRR